MEYIYPISILIGRKLEDLSRPHVSQDREAHARLSLQQT